MEPTIERRFKEINTDIQVTEFVESSAEDVFAILMNVVELCRSQQVMIEEQEKKLDGISRYLQMVIGNGMLPSGDEYIHECKIKKG